VRAPSSPSASQQASHEKTPFCTCLPGRLHGPGRYAAGRARAAPGRADHAELCRRRDRSRGPHHGRDHRAQHRGGPAGEGHDEPVHRKAGVACRPPTTSSWQRCGCRATRWWSPAASTRWCPRPTPSCRAAQCRSVRWAGGSQIVTQIFRLNYESGQQPGADPAPADQPQQHHQREPRQQLAGHHRLRRQPAAPGAHHRRAGRVQRHRCRGDPAQARHGIRPGAAGGAPD
jgi:hypothetical protein